jgi:hypothetical protein
VVPDKTENDSIDEAPALAWFSASVRNRISIAGNPEHDELSVIVFRADGFAEAEARARELGASREQSYLNGEGERVEWRLMRVETLDMLGEVLEDGREVYTESRPVADLDNASDRPGQTGV